jgi:membrane protein implicated in regulation of membrane protease activity
MAWTGLQALQGTPTNPPIRLEDEFGVAENPLEPEGLVRVHAETWSATPLKGTLRAGAHVQVIGADGVRLEIWSREVIDVHSGHS